MDTDGFLRFVGPSNGGSSQGFGLSCHLAAAIISDSDVSLAAQTPKPGDAVHCPILQAGFGQKLFNSLACAERNRSPQGRYIIQLGPEFLRIAKNTAHGFTQPAVVFSQ